MKAKKSGDIRAFLEGFRKSHSESLLSAIYEKLEILDLDKAHSKVLEIDSLIRLASEQVARANIQEFFDQKAARRGFWAFFERLEEIGWGRLIVGRRGHPSRFDLRMDLVGEEAGPSSLRWLLREMNLPYYADDSPSEVAIAERAEAPGRKQVVDRIKAHRAELRKFGVESLSLFGSVARNEAKASSDVDLLVSFKDAVTSDSYFGLKFFLEDLLGRRIDLVTSDALREPIRRAIEPELLSVA